jgi:hypothetical protein
MGEKKISRKVEKKYSKGSNKKLLLCYAFKKGSNTKSIT